jgi:diguanylate cyclase (GGDEF)-like protein/PAS domain S-box-containing protein
VTAASRLEPADLDVILERLLANNPQAPITAINATGFFIPMPPSVPLTEQRVIEGHATALELVVPEDMSAIIEAWTTARATGAAQTTVHLASDPLRPVTLRYVDAMHRHGVYLGLFEVVGSEQVMSALQDSPTLRPKVSLVQKNELAFILGIDQATTQILGWAEDEMVGHRTLEFIDPDDHARAITSWMDMLRAPGSRRRVRLRHKHRDGSWVWIEVTNHNLLNHPSHGYILTEMLDVSEEMAAQEALRAREHLLRRLTEALPLGILQVDLARRILYRNARFAAIVGSQRGETVDQQFSHVLPENRSALDAALRAVLAGADEELEIRLQRTPRDVRRLSLSLRALSDENGTATGAIVAVADVTESTRMRQELEDRATYDVLTGCHNRASILELLDRTLAEQSRRPGGTGVVFIDLDRFKQLNDRLGHAAGDAFLVETVQRLSRGARELGVVGRLGGDEFLVVCGGVESEVEALQIGHRIKHALGRSAVSLDAEDLVPAASIGVAWTRDCGLNADALVARADEAMYVSKRQRLGRPVLWTDFLSTAA